MCTQKMVKKVLRKILGLSNKKTDKRNNNIFTRKSSTHHSGIPQDVLDFATEYAKRNSQYYKTK